MPTYKNIKGFTVGILIVAACAGSRSFSRRSEPTVVHAAEDSFKSSCTVDMDKPTENAQAFIKIRPNGTLDLTDHRSYVRYICRGFRPLTGVTGTVEGSFDISTKNTSNEETGGGAGYVAMHLQFESPNEVPADVSACFKPAGLPCSGIASDPVTFPFPASPQKTLTKDYAIADYAINYGNGWVIQPLQGQEKSIPATGESNDKGDVVFDVFVVRAVRGVDVMIPTRPEHYLTAQSKTIVKIATITGE